MHSLAVKWGLRSAAQSSVRENAPLAPEHMARMRSLWSMMRMWMEWTYSWDRWEEFPKWREQLAKTDVYTIRRIVAKDRGLDWDK